MVRNAETKEEGPLLQQRLDEMNQRWVRLKTKSVEIRWVHRKRQHYLLFAFSLKVFPQPNWPENVCNFVDKILLQVPVKVGAACDSKPSPLKSGGFTENVKIFIVLPFH